MKLSSPKIIWWNGKIVPWENAVVHVTSETAMRGTNVFEGLRAYWCAQSGIFKIVALEQHLNRLRESAQIINLPADNLLSTLSCGIKELIKELGCFKNLYLRPTIYLEYGSYTASNKDLKLGTFIVGRPTEPRNNQPISCIISTWQRISDLSLPTLAKVGASYTAFRLARMEAATQGADEAILLNSQGLVAETGGASIFIVRNGKVFTPPLADGILNGITRRIAIELLTTQLDIAVTEQSILRSELYIADEVFICGTLDEIRSVKSIDNRRLKNAPGPITKALRDLYLNICEGREGKDKVWWLSDIQLP